MPETRLLSPVGQSRAVSRPQSQGPLGDFVQTWTFHAPLKALFALSFVSNPPSLDYSFRGHLAV